MGSSRVRRQARHLFSSALESARTTRWRSAGPFGFSWGLPRAFVKASNTAEKSGGSKPRRKRGLRKGKRRSRGCHPRRTVSWRQPLPNGFSERSFKKALAQFDFWELRIDQLRQRLVNPVKEEFKFLQVRTSVGSYEKRFDKGVFDRYAVWYWNLRGKILKAHCAARPLVSDARHPIHTTFCNFLYREFKWVPPSYPGGLEKYRSEILDDLVRLVRKDFVNPPPLSEKKRRVVAAREARRSNRVGHLEKYSDHVCTSGVVCRLCGKSKKPLAKGFGRRSQIRGPFS